MQQWLGQGTSSRGVPGDELWYLCRSANLSDYWSELHTKRSQNHLYWEWDLHLRVRNSRLQGKMHWCYCFVFKYVCWFALEMETILFNLWDVSAVFIQFVWTYFFCLTDSKQLRLNNGTHRCSGRLEIFHEGQWGTVCDDKWGMQEVAVACRELNCGTAIAAKYKAFYGRGHDQIWLDDVECAGDEKFLTDCRHRGLGENDCDHNEDAGLLCSGTTSFPGC